MLREENLISIFSSIYNSVCSIDQRIFTGKSTASETGFLPICGIFADGIQGRHRLGEMTFRRQFWLIWKIVQNIQARSSQLEDVIAFELEHKKVSLFFGENLRRCSNILCYFQ